jgi:xanthine dehydrogenase small subunit
MTSNTIKFVWENKIHSISNLDPNETILNYVRLKLKKTGTKEGCAEGGCGACTVVLGELKNNKIFYQAINSCIGFATSLEGKQLILVEDLVLKNGTLHAVQDAMINYHGSQCGFCTPGFVMSLFAMYKNFSSYNKENIQDSISGNLCRCTGYRSIVDAAKSLNNTNRSDQFDKNKKKIINLLKKINSENVSLKNENKKYFSPKSINELIKTINNNPNSIFLSGGTDLSLNVTKGRKDINKIISLNLVKELKFIKERNGNIEVGAVTSLTEFELFIKKYYPDFNAILKRYGSVQIRNIGTIAGNIATASPIGDTLPLLLSLDAKVVLQKKSKKTILPLKNFFISYRKTKLKKEQCIHSVIIPIF